TTRSGCVSAETAARTKTYGRVFCCISIRQKTLPYVYLAHLYQLAYACAFSSNFLFVIALPSVITLLFVIAGLTRNL
ncbi:MAG: hypothetical protein PHV66_06930, partial [Bacteroidales bacterium]|nr:hypothetical protein [Bacteroidales bacterium]